jgi:hypothetical protein
LGGDKMMKVDEVIELLGNYQFHSDYCITGAVLLEIDEAEEMTKLIKQQQKVVEAAKKIYEARE